MAIEPKRGCGYRKVGGLYLVGGYLEVSCDRLPYPIEYCPTCGAGIQFSQGFQWIDAFKMFGFHPDCQDKLQPCLMCQPLQGVKYGLMWVGEAYYTTESFIKEAREMGVSKRIPYIPKEIEVNETPILLAHKKAIRLFIPDSDEEWSPGIFCAFIPRGIEMPMWQSELNDDKIAELEKRGITPIPIPDNDPDHAPGETVIGFDPITKHFSRVLS